MAPAPSWPAVRRGRLGRRSFPSANRRGRLGRKSSSSANRRGLLPRLSSASANRRGLLPRASPSAAVRGPRRKSLPPDARDGLRGPSAGVLRASRESPPACGRPPVPREPFPDGARPEALAPFPVGARLVLREPLSAWARPALRKPPLAGARPPSRGLSPADGRAVRRVPSSVRDAGFVRGAALRRAWFPAARAPPAAAGFRRAGPPGVLAPREVFGFPPLAPRRLGVPDPSATLTNLQPQHYALLKVRVIRVPCRCPTQPGTGRSFAPEGARTR